MPESVDDYLAALPGNTRRTLERLRRAIRKAAPEAAEGISYRIPVYKHLGTLVGFAAFPKHCAFYPMSTTVLSGFARELVDYEVAGTTIHFSPDRALSTALVTRIVEARIKENEARKRGKR